MIDKVNPEPAETKVEVDRWRNKRGASDCLQKLLILDFFRRPYLRVQLTTSNGSTS